MYGQVAAWGPEAVSLVLELAADDEALDALQVRRPRVARARVSAPGRAMQECPTLLRAYSNACWSGGRGTRRR